MILADLAGSWVLSRGGSHLLMPAQGEVAGTEFHLKVPDFASAGLRLELRVEGEGLVGMYRLGSGSRAPVQLALDDGALVGFPQGFRNRERWSFRRP